MHKLLKYLMIGSIFLLPAGLLAKHFYPKHVEQPKVEKVIKKPEVKKVVAKKKKVVVKKKQVQQPQPKSNNPWNWQ